jgi:hypothetical protein
MCIPSQGQEEDHPKVFGVTSQTSFAITPTRLPHRDVTQHHVLL